MHKETVLFMMKPAWGAVRSHVRRHVVGLCIGPNEELGEMRYSKN